MEGVVRGEGRVHVGGAQRLGEGLVRRAHGAAIGVGEAREGQLGGELMQGGDDRERVPRRAAVQWRDTREALRRRLHQAVLLEPAQRLPHRRPAQAEPRAQLLVAQPLLGRERAVDDRVANRHVGLVSEQVAVERSVFGGNWHVKYQYATRILR